MDKEFSKAALVEQWKKEICNHIRDYEPYEINASLKRILNFFIPGKYYFYVVNFHNLTMEYAHSGTQEILGLPNNEFTAENFLNLFSNEELQKFKAKEALVADFLFNFIKPEEILNYKVCYFLKVRSVNGEDKKILHQANALTIDESGKVQHVLGIHLEVNHLNFLHDDKVSFIHLNGGQSYYNLDPSNPTFAPENAMSVLSLSDELTDREIEIVKAIALGKTSESIAQELNISENTVNTHRRKIIRKMRCQNMNEVIAQGVAEGVVR